MRGAAAASDAAREAAGSVSVKRMVMMITPEAACGCRATRRSSGLDERKAARARVERRDFRHVLGRELHV